MFYLLDFSSSVSPPRPSGVPPEENGRDVRWGGRVLAQEEFLGGGATWGVDAEEVGAAGPGGDVEGGAQACGLAVEDAAARGVVGLDAQQAEAGEHRGAVDGGVGLHRHIAAQLSQVAYGKSVATRDDSVTTWYDGITTRDDGVTARYDGVTIGDGGVLRGEDWEDEVGAVPVVIKRPFMGPAVFELSPGGDVIPMGVFAIIEAEAS